jgi:hypothetical protein
VNQVGERSYDPSLVPYSHEDWDPTISAFKLMFRWGLRQHAISFFQMKRDLEAKHEVIFGMCVLLFDPQLNELSLEKKNLIYMYVEETVYELTKGAAGYPHNTEKGTRLFLMNMVRSFLSTVSHDERLNIDRLCFPLLTAERRLVHENVAALLRDLEEYKGEMWLNMLLSRGGGSGSVAYFYFLIKSVFEVCDQVDVHIREEHEDFDDMISLIEREGFKRARTEREHKQVSNLQGYLGGSERQVNSFWRRWRKREKKIEEARREEARRRALTQGSGRDMRK